jgi:hypothetical protein
VEVVHESDGIGEENLPQMQDHPPQGRGAGHLPEPAAQAAAGMNPGAERLDKSLSGQL